MMQRRDFIKQTCFACVGIATISSLLESCGAPKSILKTNIENNQIKIPLESFANTKSQIIQNKQLPYQILLIKNNDHFNAIQLRCTHNEFALNFVGNKIVCNAHGSEFNLNGKVIKPPAEVDLTQYKTTVENNFVIINL